MLNKFIKMKLYYILPVFSMFIVSFTTNDEFLSFTYILKMLLALALLIISGLLLYNDAQKKNETNKKE